MLDDRLYPDLVAGDAAASFFALMKAVADRWKDRIKAEVLYPKPRRRTAGNRRKPVKQMIIKRIVSGGQTGADRAGLDFAIEHGLKHGGWCPKGRRAEDGRIPGRYELKETQATSYVRRTEWNVRDSDGTVIFTVMIRLTGARRKRRIWPGNTASRVFISPPQELQTRSGVYSVQQDQSSECRRVTSLQRAGPWKFRETCAVANVGEQIEPTPCTFPGSGRKAIITNMMLRPCAEVWPDDTEVHDFSLHSAPLTITRV